MSDYVDHTVCAECGGVCCKGASGITFPRDFGFTAVEIETALVAAFASGMWIVDHWEGYCPSVPDGSEGRFVRPRHDTDPCDPVECATWGGHCLFLFADGCALPDDSRPTTCRSLEPARKPNPCTQHIEDQKLEAARQWWRYRGALSRAIARAS